MLQTLSVSANRAIHGKALAYTPQPFEGKLLPKTPNQKSSRSHESSVQAALAQVYGEDEVTMTPGSGNQPGSPGDVRVRSEWLVECKTTAKDQITIPHRWLRKVQTEAMLGGLRSLLSIRFGNNSNRVYYVIEDRDLYALMHRERTNT